MKFMVNATELAEWAEVARSAFPEPIVIHTPDFRVSGVVPECEIRCGKLRPLRLRSTEEE